MLGLRGGAPFRSSVPPWTTPRTGVVAPHPPLELVSGSEQSLLHRAICKPQTNICLLSSPQTCRIYVVKCIYLAKILRRGTCIGPSSHECHSFQWDGAPAPRSSRPAILPGHGFGRCRRANVLHMETPDSTRSRADGPSALDDLESARLP